MHNLPRITTMTVTCPACDKLHVAVFDYHSPISDSPVFTADCPQTGAGVMIVATWTIQAIPPIVTVGPN